MSFFSSFFTPCSGFRSLFSPDHDGQSRNCNSNHPIPHFFFVRVCFTDAMVDQFLRTIPCRRPCHGCFLSTSSQIFSISQFRGRFAHGAFPRSVELPRDFSSPSPLFFPLHTPPFLVPAPLVPGAGSRCSLQKLFSRTKSVSETPFPFFFLFFIPPFWKFLSGRQARPLYPTTPKLGWSR